MQYRREVDGLRAVAVVPVMLWHAGLGPVPGGFAGVDIFFAISGFLIATILYDEIVAGQFSILRFYERRARRILPALFLVLGVTWLFGWAWLLPDAFASLCSSILAAVLFASNIQFWLTTNYFSPAEMLVPLIHTWSLAVEEQFYLVFPILLAGLWRVAPRHVLTWLVLGALASLAFSEWSWRTEPEANFFLAPTRAWELLSGAAAAVYCARRGVVAGGQILSGLGLAMMVLSFFIYDAHTPFPSVYALVPVMGAVLVLIWGRAGTWVAVVLGWRPLVGIGIISYSAYLWHQPIFALARLRLAGPPSPGLMGALCLLALGLAALGWRFVEQPFRQRSAAPAIATGLMWRLAAGGAVGLALVAGAGILTHGARFRLPPAAIALDDQFAREFSERIRIARVGPCELNTKFLNISINDYESHWACHPQKGSGLTDSHIAVFGDSHSSDVASALRQNGLDVLHVAGAGCALGPKLMEGKCRQLADFAKARIAAGGIAQLWLAERFEPRELRPADIRDLLAFWHIDGVALTLFSPMPEFPDMRERMVRAMWLGQRAALPRDQTAEAAFFTADNLALLRAAGVRVIDSGAIFCAGQTVCSPVDGDRLLMVDGQHLSDEGARRFGTALVALAEAR